MERITVREYGGPEVMRLEQISLPEPGENQALVRIAAAGVNFIDVYERKGTYRGEIPLGLGREGAGVVERVGPRAPDPPWDTSEAPLSPGDRVAWAGIMGSYATHVLAPAAKLVPVPDGLDLAQAAMAMLQGMTAHYLVHESYAVQPGDTVLVHAAAGGVGRLVTQMAKMRGARVVGTVSTAHKATVARDAGIDEVILYTEQDFAEEVRLLTDDRGVQAVYDGVGRTTFDKDLDCLAPLGHLILFGAASGPVSPIDPIVLMQKGSLYLQRPMLGAYTASREALLSRADDVLAWVTSGELELLLGGAYPLAEAPQAHSDLEGRKTTGKLILLPPS